MNRILFLFALFSLPANAAPKTTISCEKYGRNGQPAFVKTHLNFEIDGPVGERMIHDLRGEVHVGNSKKEVDEESGAYIGEFAIGQRLEDSKYRPVKYKDSSKFPKIDANATRGAEAGMWGYLVVPFETRGEFESHYVFQAGDHMGGTVHMKCQEMRGISP